MTENKKTYKEASVKVMRSYDYNNFEISLSREEMTRIEINEMRKDAMRLVDESVRQFKVAKEAAANGLDKFAREELERRVKIISENYPKSEWTEEQIQLVTKLDKDDYIKSHSYDYDDDIPF